MHLITHYLTGWADSLPLDLKARDRGLISTLRQRFGDQTGERASCRMVWSAGGPRGGRGR